MKGDVRISLLYFVFLLIRPGICEGIEKVSYLLQYGPGVHTVFEQENPPEKVTVNVKDRVAPSTTPSTLTSKTTTNSSVEVAASTTTVSHTPSSDGTAVQLHSDAAVTESVPHTASNVGMHSTEKNSDISSTISTNAQTPPPASSEEKQRPTGSMAPDDRRRNPVSGACRTPASVLQKKFHPLPLPPPLPTFGAILRSDVMVNLKPKELRTLMSTYIGLIEAYKGFNQQQKRNIAHLEEELARHEAITHRANRLRDAKVEILNK
ncbi:uncharacterized protein LOC128305346 [Anopheles moucheti]|uniref:uncharacterized protein LOC128305346 n=1 Tax=Anopheles moucheti TaxID=186751 RepID=UPI0022F04527|nr:uncharacterized protein LOC128305346 [Anopheles moucheti]